MASLREDADRLHAALKQRGQTLVPIEVAAQRSGLSMARVLELIDSLPGEFRTTVKPIFGRHLLGSMSTATAAQTEAMRLRQRTGRLLGAEDRGVITEEWARRLLEAQIHGRRSSSATATP